jgi:hypothetical protein
MPMLAGVLLALPPDRSRWRAGALEPAAAGGTVSSLARFEHVHGTREDLPGNVWQSPLPRCFQRLVMQGEHPFADGSPDTRRV